MGWHFCYLYLTDLQDPEINCVYLQFFLEHVAKELTCLTNATSKSVFPPCFPRDRGLVNLSPIRNTNFTRRNHQMNPPFHFQILKMQPWIKGKMILSDTSYFPLFIHNKRTIQTRNPNISHTLTVYFIAITVTVILDAYNCIIIGSN